MARWLQDAETGEYFREDELDAESYAPVSDWQSLGDTSVSDAPQYEYPSWFTNIPYIGSVPARALGSLAKGGAGLEKLIGDPFGAADDHRKRATDLIDQARRESGAEEGSWRDIAATVAGEGLAMLPTLGGGLAYNAARGAGRGLGSLYLAALPAALPAGDRYAAYREKGIEPIPAALGTGANFVVDSALNLFDVGQILKPGAASLGRAAKAALVGGGTNVGGAVLNANVDSLTGAPQTPEEYARNLLIQGAVGAGTTGLLSQLPDRIRIPGTNNGPQQVSPDDFEAMMSGGDGPDIGGASGGPSRGSLTLDSDIPTLETVPQTEPLIQPVEGYRARDLEGRQRQLEDLLLPADSELAGLRQSAPTPGPDVIDIQRIDPSGEPIIRSFEDIVLTPEERRAVSATTGTSPSRIAQSQASDYQRALEDMLARRDSLRAPGGSRLSTADQALLLNLGSESQSFPQPLAGSRADGFGTPVFSVEMPPGVTREITPGPIALAPQRALGPQPESLPAVQPVEVSRSREPAVRFDPEARPARTSRTFYPDSELPIIGAESSAFISPEITLPDAPTTPGGSIILDPTSDLAQSRAASRRLIRGERQQAPEIQTVEGYRPKASDAEMATIVRGDNAPTIETPTRKVSETESFAQPLLKAAPSPTAQAPELDLFGQPIERPVVRAPVERYDADLTPPLYTELSPRAQAETMPTYVVPMKQVALDPEIPNFKGDAGVTGEVAGKELKGETYNAANGPIVVMRRTNKPNGPFSIITGRHRFAYRGRLGLENIEAKIIDESPTFGPREAQALDAELNIIDGHGTITDFANYFNKAGMTEEEAFRRGLLSREGQTGYNIGMKATENIWAAWRDGVIPDRMASGIANAAPLNAGLQEHALKLARRGKAQYQIEGALRSMEKLQESASAMGDQGDMFRNDAQLQRQLAVYAEMEAVKKDIRDKLVDEVRSFEAAAKRPELAKKRLNFKGDATPEGLLKEAERLKLEAAKYGDDINLHPGKLAEVEALATERMRNGDDSRDETVQRISNKRKSAINSAEGGFINLEDIKGVLKLFDKGARETDMAGFEGISKANQHYSGKGIAGTWRKNLEWMDTTMRKFPQAKAFIEAYWRVPQDQNAIAYDANLTLKPYMGLSDLEMKPVNNFLVAARRKGAEGYKVTREGALKLGLTERQANAVVAVNQWSKDMLNELHSHAIKGAEHEAFKRMQQVTTPEGKAKVEADLAEKTAEISSRFDAMRDTNYVPFNRYGEYYVRWIGADGTVRESRRFDKKDKNFFAAKSHLEQLAKQQGGEIKAGQADPLPIKRGEYDGVSHDILDILNDDAGDVSTKGFYKHLKEAALIPGESDDLLRNISEYTTGAAKLIALQRAQRAADVELASTLKGIDNANLNRRLLSWAEGFHQTDPRWLQTLNKGFNIAYIGGNLRTPTADILGKIQLQYSMLGKYLKGLDVEKTYISTIGKEVQWWTQPERFAKNHPELAAAIKDAQRRGVIPSTVYRDLTRKAKGNHNSAIWSGLDKVHDAYFGLKAFTEKSTDLSGFINGWEAYPKIAKNTPNGSRQQFAENFARESRAVPSQGELPAIGKNPLVRTITKYQLYKAKILKNMMENGWDVRTRYLLATGMTTGLMGLPFVPNAITLSRTEGNEPEAALRKAGLGDAAIYGPLSALSGIDLSSSAGFGEIFPGSGQDAIQKGILGMAQAPFDQFKRMRGYMDKGQDLQALAATPMMPNLLANIARGADWADRGVMTSSGQAIIPQKDVTMRQVLVRMAGWTPLEVRKEQTLNNIRKQAAYLAKDNDNINQRLGEAEALKKWDTVKELESMARTKGIKINSAQVRKYREAALGNKNLSVDNAPREIRQELKDWEKLFR